MSTVVKFCRVTYKGGCEKNYVIPDRTILFVTSLPWYKSLFGLYPTRMLLGNGVTPFKKLKFI